MNWKRPLAAFGINGRGLRRLIVMLACPAMIIWLGGDAITHIGELYDGLCVMQGPGAAALLYDDNRLGYCTGIGSDLRMLGYIMGIAALAVPAALLAWWDYADRSVRKISD
jgi:hypothetical protein